MNSSDFKIIDIHSHILWDVDDGPETLEESCKILEDAIKQGLTAVVLTPHYSRRFASVSDRDVLSEKMKKLQELFPQVSFVLGQELRWHEDLPERILSGAALPINNGKYALVEFEPGDSYDTVSRGLREIREAGKIPVLAHTERYGCLDAEKIKELRRGGTRIQMNYESLHGSFLDREVGRCRKLVKAGLVDLLASDVHNLSERAFTGKKTAQLCERLYGREETERLMYFNPAEIAGLEYDSISSSRCGSDSTGRTENPEDQSVQIPGFRD